MRKGVARRCKFCGAALSRGRWMICENCQAAGFGARRTERIDARELLEIIRQREQTGRPPLEGLSIEQITALARMFQPPYSTYGRLRGHVDATGRLPGRELERA